MVARGWRFLITALMGGAVFGLARWFGQRVAGLPQGSALTVAGFAAGIITSGLGWWATRELVNHPEQPGRVLLAEQNAAPGRMRWPR